MILQVITGAGHHVYADRSETFNKYVLEACALSDSIPHLTSSNLHPYAKPVNEQEIAIDFTKDAIGVIKQEELDTRSKSS